jgi:hypothetical protein
MTEEMMGRLIERNRQKNRKGGTDKEYLKRETNRKREEDRERKKDSHTDSVEKRRPDRKTDRDK